MTYTIENNNYKAAVSTTGSELQSLFAKGFGLECMWNGDPSVWAKRAPLLFPIVGRLPNDRYTLNGKEYNMGLHGFVRAMEFELLKQQNDRIQFRLKASDETRKMYPFDFTLISDYCLSEKYLSVTRIVENHSPDPMPFNIGEHFGFRTPFFPGEKITDYRLTFPNKETAPRHPLTEKHHTAKPESFLEDTREIAITEDLFERDALVFLALRSREVSLGKAGGKAALTVRYADYPDIVFWSKAGAKVPFVCIEPWNGHDVPENSAADIFKRADIFTLEPGKSRSFTTQIEVS